jgi:hypothetical protein
VAAGVMSLRRRLGKWEIPDQVVTSWCPTPNPPGLLKSCGEEGIAAAAATIAERAGRG